MSGKDLGLVVIAAVIVSVVAVVVLNLLNVERPAIVGGAAAGGVAGAIAGYIASKKRAKPTPK